MLAQKSLNRRRHFIPRLERLEERSLPTASPLINVTAAQAKSAALWCEVQQDLKACGVISFEHTNAQTHRPWVDAALVELGRTGQIGDILEDRLDDLNLAVVTVLTPDPTPECGYWRTYLLLNGVGKLNAIGKIELPSFLLTSDARLLPGGTPITGFLGRHSTGERFQSLDLSLLGSEVALTTSGNFSTGTAQYPTYHEQGTVRGHFQPKAVTASLQSHLVALHRKLLWYTNGDPASPAPFQMAKTQLLLAAQSLGLATEHPSWYNVFRNRVLTLGTPRTKASRGQFATLMLSLADVECSPVREMYRETALLMGKATWLNNGDRAALPGFNMQKTRLLTRAVELGLPSSNYTTYVRLRAAVLNFRSGYEPLYLIMGFVSSLKS